MAVRVVPSSATPRRSSSSSTGANRLGCRDSLARLAARPDRAGVAFEEDEWIAERRLRRGGRGHPVPQTRGLRLHVRRDGVELRELLRPLRRANGARLTRHTGGRRQPPCEEHRAAEVRRGPCRSHDVMLLPIRRDPATDYTNYARRGAVQPRAPVVRFDVHPVSSSRAFPESSFRLRNRCHPRPIPVVSASG